MTRILERLVWIFLGASLGYFLAHIAIAASLGRI